MRAFVLFSILACFVISSFFIPACKDNPQVLEEVDEVALPPSISIVQPLDGDTITGVITIAAQVMGDVDIEMVEFYIDASLATGGTITNPPYEYVWNTGTLPDSSRHGLLAKLTAVSGDILYSDLVAVVVIHGYEPPEDSDTIPPIVTVTHPSNGATVRDVVRIVANASDNVAIENVQFYIDGVLPEGATVTGKPYEYNWDTNELADGSIHVLYARAIDTSDNIALSDAIEVTVDNSDGGGEGEVVLNEDFRNHQIFPSDNWWNLDISNAPVDPRSSEFISWIGSSRGLHPDFGNHPYGIPYVGVSGSQELLPVTWVKYGDESDDGASGRPDGYPIPDIVKTDGNYIEGGSAGGAGSGDRHLLLIDRDNWLLFETWETRWNSELNRWEAGSGAVFNLATNDRRPEGWTSSDAAGLAVFPGLVKYEEVYESGEITHAFRFTTRSTNGYVWPASHRAGSNPDAPPLGTRLRLKASVDISGYPEAMQKIFRAMKKYGLILADNGSDMYIQGTMDSRWNNDILNPAFAGLKAGDFEVIELGWNPNR